MLQTRHLPTIKAALQYWQEEICPHGPPAMRPYLADENAEALSADEVADLQTLFGQAIVRYLLYDVDMCRATSDELFVDADDARQRAGGASAVAAVILPAPAE